MKTKLVKLDDILDIINDYFNQMGETISEKAKCYLEEQIENCSFECETEN